ncbi:MAG: efflux RND transporter periplasmic adaptor subunit [Verrucomicrobiales bacterium]
MKSATPAPALAPAPARPRNKPAKSAWRGMALWIVVGALAASVGAALKPRPVEVNLAATSIGPLTVSVLEEGKTRIRHRYVVAAPVAGMLERIPRRAGDPLEAGKTPIAVIQPSPSSFLDPRTQAEAAARVQMAEAAQRQRQAQLERARAALDNAEKEKTRVSRLHKGDAVSERELDQALNQAELLVRELHAAEFALEVSRFEIIQAQAAASQAGTITDESSAPITLLAPVTGFVLNVYEESARPVTPGLALLEVGDPSDLEAEIELLSSDAVAVRPGAEVSLEQWGGEHPLRGKVTVIEPGGFTKFSALGVEEQRVKVRVDFIDPIPPDRPLGDRYRVEARIVTWQGDRVLQVPAGALFRRGNEWMTFVHDHGRARATRVEIGHHNGVAAEVRSGLTAGQQVILHPPDAIDDGKAVRPRP